ncbi:Ig-like domain-containing protein [Synechocystis sp. PCC 7509]|uniref:Ig-like domain-containing protein n=1 Tax=Synechocystis sp. PCC 7509 TaxID=927677 RepID=UPI0002ACA3E3|nr:Ig-like domain-containing protein [Synechocystis sp. PCC 7509]
MSVTKKSFLQPLDRVAIALIAVLGLLTALVLFQGDAIAPRVRDFSWQNKRIGVEDTAFYLNFSRPMDTKSVEANLQIDPTLPGKISWAGRKMAYTLLSPPAYGTSYQVKLNGALDRFSKTNTNSIQSFTGAFTSRDRAFAYLGVEGEEQGKLVLYNLTTQQKTILTPKDLVVGDFQPYPTGNKILFSATERASDRSSLPLAQLYTVTTGISPEPKSKNNPPLGRVELVLDSKDYQNLKFDLSADGKTILVQRVNQKNPGDFGLWILPSSNDNTLPKAQLLKSQPGGDFLITPDSKSVAVAQGQGVAILPLITQATKPLDFLPKFGMVLEFSPDGSQAAMIRFNSDYTRSLFLVNNQGLQKELLRTTGSINSCIFHPVLSNLYCMLTQLIEGEVYQEQPYLAAIDLNSGKQTPLIVMPEQRDVQISLSPDGLALLLDQIVTSAAPNTSPQINVPRTSDGEAISTSRLWLVPLFVPASISTTPNQIQPEQLPLPGFHPRWLP